VTENGFKEPKKNHPGDTGATGNSQILQCNDIVVVEINLNSIAMCTSLCNWSCERSFAQRIEQHFFALFEFF
jgi:hypothetical protein